MLAKEHSQLRSHTLFFSLRATRHVKLSLWFLVYEILATHVQHRFAQANGSSTNTTRVHALLLSSKH